jgi:hypothetical protein
MPTEQRSAVEGVSHLGTYCKTVFYGIDPTIEIPGRFGLSSIKIQQARRQCASATLSFKSSGQWFLDSLMFCQDDDEWHPHHPNNSNQFRSQEGGFFINIACRFWTGQRQTPCERTIVTIDGDLIHIAFFRSLAQSVPGFAVILRYESTAPERPERPRLVLRSPPSETASVEKTSD